MLRIAKDLPWYLKTRADDAQCISPLKKKLVSCTSFHPTAYNLQESFCTSQNWLKESIMNHVKMNKSLSHLSTTNDRYYLHMHADIELLLEQHKSTKRKHTHASTQPLVCIYTGDHSRWNYIYISQGVFIFIVCLRQGLETNQPALYSNMVSQEIRIRLRSKGTVQ